MSRVKKWPPGVAPLGSDVSEGVVALKFAVPVRCGTSESGSASTRCIVFGVSKDCSPIGYDASNDPNFILKLGGVLGLYADLPAHAIVRSLEERSEIQALDRRQPALPMGTAGPAP